MAPGAGGDAFTGAVLQMTEAATLGLPCEIVKTYMGRNRGCTTPHAISEVFKAKGISGFWNGFTPKMIESGLKGPVLLVSKEACLDACKGIGVSPVIAGTTAGVVGGVTQTFVMAPMTFLVTRAVSGKSDGTPLMTLVRDKGIRGMYAGSVPIALRQASNWGLRQGFNDMFRQMFLKYNHGGQKGAKLTKWEEVACGILGGTFACINQPFEVARIEMQWRQAEAKGANKISTVEVLSLIYKQRGIRGWYAALTPRIGLSVWQTLFMVTFARFIREHMDAKKS